MTKVIEKKVSRSPILVSRLYKNWDMYGKKKMIRLSVKKLKKIGDPETLLCRTVLINNTLESVKSNKSLPGPSLERSQYNEDEQRILNRVLLPDYLTFHDSPAACSTITTLPEPITPLSDDEEPEEELEEDPGKVLSSVSLQQQDTSLQPSEDLYEKNRRAIFNSYLSLCSNDKYDCNSVMAA